MANKERKEKPYAVILFLPKRDDGTDDVDLVPSSWICEEKGHTQCRYPGPTSYKKIPAMVSRLEPPAKEWRSYPVEILIYARNLEEGQRRLKRSYTSFEVRSTDEENNRPLTRHSDSAGRSKISLKEGLRQLKPMSAIFGDDEDSIDSAHSTTRQDFVQPLKERSEARQDEDAVYQDVPRMQEINGDMPRREDNLERQGFGTSQTQRDLELRLNELSGEIQRQLDPFVSLMKEYFDARLKFVVMELRNEMSSLRRSFQYDLKERINEVKHTIIASAIEVPKINDLSNAKTTLGIAFPISSAEEFIAFDKSLIDSEEKRNAMVTLFRVITYGEKSVKNCIAKIMGGTLTKAAELQYSGTGKKIHGIGKKDFSKTQVFDCMKEVIIERFGNCEDVKSLPGKVGRWLSGANDREGGRQIRSENDKKKD